MTETNLPDFPGHSWAIRIYPESHSLNMIIREVTPGTEWTEWKSGDEHTLEREFYSALQAEGRSKRIHHLVETETKVEKVTTGIVFTKRVDRTFYRFRLKDDHKEVFNPSFDTAEDGTAPTQAEVFNMALEAMRQYQEYLAKIADWNKLAGEYPPKTLGA